MNKKGIFIILVFSVCFVVGIFMNSLGYKRTHLLAHGKRLKEKFEEVFHNHLNRNRTFSGGFKNSNDNTTHVDTSQTGFQNVIHEVLRTLRKEIYEKKPEKETVKVNDDDGATNVNISQAEFEITHEVLRSLGGEFDEKKLRKEYEKVNSTKKRKVVMAYTSFFGDKHFFVKEEDYNTNHGRKCPFYQCEFTTNKTHFTQSDAVIFHARDMTSLEELRNLQKTRPSHQRWIYFIMENPIYTPDPSPYNAMFNWTLTYRADSDLRFPYGNYFPKITPWTEQESLKKLVGGKNKLVFWAASHCGLLRDKYVGKLRKYMKVDVFGSCGAALGGGSGSCARSSKDCTEKLKQYKFALALENQMCEDYITEKYWGKFLIGVVPVVMGGSNYNSNIAVPGSYINAADFPTVQALANYLLYLDKNNTAYMEFFEWRKKFNVIKDSMFYFKCALCAKLNLDQKPKVYKRLDETWSKSRHCGKTDKIYNDIINRS